MNQAILFNDDLIFDDNVKSWFLTGCIAGEKFIVQIPDKYYAKGIKITTEMKFDLEINIENWLRQNEPTDGRIILSDLDEYN